MKLLFELFLVCMSILALVAIMGRTLLVYPGRILIACIMALFLLLTCGCAGITVAEVGIGPQNQLHTSNGAPRDWKGEGGRVDIRLRRISEDGVRYCEWMHESNLTSGWPFNNHYEDFEERVSCGVRVNLTKVLDDVWKYSQ